MPAQENGHFWEIIAPLSYYAPFSCVGKYLVSGNFRDRALPSRSDWLNQKMGGHAFGQPDMLIRSPKGHANRMGRGGPYREDNIPALGVRDAASVIRI